jgi:hypothetical protein
MPLRQWKEVQEVLFELREWLWLNRHARATLFVVAAKKLVALSGGIQHLRVEMDALSKLD